MKKTVLKMILTLTVSSFLCAGLTACGAKTVSEQENSDTDTSSEETSDASAAADSADETEETGNADTADVLQEEEPLVGMANPWRDTAASEIADTFTIYPGPLDGAENVVYQISDTLKMAQTMFTLDNIDYVYRVGYTEEFEDISGCYYDWDHEEEFTYQDCSAVEKRVIDESETIDVLTWYDDTFSRSLSLMAKAPDLDGFDLTAIANSLFTRFTADDCLLEYMDEKWSTVYDVRNMIGRDCEDGSVMFTYHSVLYPASGYDYACVMLLKDTTCEEVLTECKGRHGLENEESTPTAFGAKGIEAYTFTAPKETIEDTSDENGLEVIMSYVAIPCGNDVIRIEYRTVSEPDEAMGYRVSAAFETLFDNFFLMN